MIGDRRLYYGGTRKTHGNGSEGDTNNDFLMSYMKECYEGMANQRDVTLSIREATFFVLMSGVKKA